MSPLRDRLAPDSAIVALVHRGLMAWRLPGLAGHGDRVSRAVEGALRDTALGRFPAEERAWFDRIEAGARRIAARLEIPAAVRWMSMPPVWGRFLTRLVRRLEPGLALELGTGFGLSTAYQAAALELNGRGSVLSFDVEDMVAIATPALAEIGLDSRVELVAGRIEETLPGRLRGIDPIDFALVDHDHTAAGTVAALDVLLPHLRPGAAVAFDDIRWTEEMRRAWAAVEARPELERTIGLRRLGIAVVAGHRGEA